MNDGELGAAAFAWVVAAGVIAGVASLLVFQRWTDTNRLRSTVNLVVAHLFEIRLFAEEPILVLRAQRDLIAANGRILLQLARPSLILLVPVALVLATLDLFFGHAPLRNGETALVTVQLRDPVQSARLESPQGIAVETPPALVAVERQMVWRVKATGAADGNLQISTGDVTLAKRIKASGGFSWVPARRDGSVLRFLLHPGELPFSSNTIDWVEISYQGATIFHVHWLVWFSLFSFGGAGLFWFSRYFRTISI